MVNRFLLALGIALALAAKFWYIFPLAYWLIMLHAAKGCC